ncbi:tetratricopeptide repeat protein [Candidatus Gottesmanbacteria bacterium]|nr:tetratricopeptide repeat protein [Candidatus Gottesmanbacteria bacterium]
MTQERGLLIDRVGQWVTIVGLGVLPVFFLPTTQEYYDTNKWFLLAATAITLLFLWGLRLVRTGILAISWDRITKRLSLLTLTALVSLIVTSPNKVEAALAPFGAGTWIALTIFAYIVPTFLDEKTKRIMQWFIFFSISLVGLIAIYQFFGFGKIMFPNIRFLQNPEWTPIGTSVGLMTILLIVLPLMIGEALHRRRAGQDIHATIAFVMGIASLGGLILTAYQALPQWRTTTLPFWANWQIILESYKNWRQLVFGVGAENFLAAFTAGRSAALNMTTLWNTRFMAGSSFLFHIATVYGVIGAAAFIYFLLGLFKATPWLFARGGLVKFSPLHISFLIAALSLIFLPPSFPTFIVIAMILILSEPSTRISFARPGLAKLTAIASLLVVGAAVYGLTRAYGAELAFAKSLKVLEKRDGTGVYNLQIRAIGLNPRVTRFHTAYSQTNVALANALAGTATASASTEQLDKDRQMTTQLLQQAIREAKLGVSLAPRNILAWENLATVYQTLTGAAKGADQWAVAAYQQAVSLDPTNPVLRLRLGGAYVGQQKLDLAETSYLTAITLKPDYANAYYNIAFVYREQKKYLLAAQALNVALKYVTPGSDDGNRAQKELDQLRELLTDREKQALYEGVAPPVQSQNSPEPLSPLPE